MAIEDGSTTLSAGDQPDPRDSFEFIGTEINVLETSASRNSWRSAAYLAASVSLGSFALGESLNNGQMRGGEIVAAGIGALSFGLAARAARYFSQDNHAADDLRISRAVMATEYNLVNPTNIITYGAEAPAESDGIE